MTKQLNRASVWLTTLAMAAFAVGNAAYAQGPCGGKPCPKVEIKKRPATPSTGARSSGGSVTPPAGGGSGRSRGGSRGSGGSRPPRAEPPPTPPCEDAELIVVCRMAGCEITLNGRDRSVTDDLGGINFLVQGNQKYKVRVTKPGYEPFETTEEKLGCGDQREISAQLKAKPVQLRVRTHPMNCDIYLDGDKQPSGSDGQGIFSYFMIKQTMLLEARKKGHLTGTRNIRLGPELVGQEIFLRLEPISARVRLKSNADSARVTIDNQQPAKSIEDDILLSPGPHTLTVDALGYAPSRFDLTVEPDESVKREVTLARLPVTALQSQAESLFQSRAYDDVLKLSRYMHDANPDDAAAHRLTGLVHLARGDSSSAGGELNKALAGGESFSLPVRRHSGEKFDLNKGHDACNAQLILNKTELEFRSVRSPADNFKVTYDQIQVVGIQLKSGVAVYLSTKVTAGGKRRDYNFYSFDREVSQAGQPYLEMIQRLLKPH